jgi:hypothetical protein
MISDGTLEKFLEEQMSKLTLAANAWIEPMRYWIEQASDLNRIARNAEQVAMKQAFTQIDGLNLFLKSKKVQPTAALEASPPKNIWVLLRKTQEKRVLSHSVSEKSCLLVEFYNSARTYFSTKC